MSDKKDLTLYICLVFGIMILLASSLLIKPNYITNFDELVNNDTGGIDVNIQDQTTRPFDIRMNQVLNSVSYSLVNSPEINQNELNLTTTAGLSVGDTIAFLEQNGMAQILFGEIENIAGNTITLDTPVPYSFIPSNTTVFTYDNDITVDGSVNKQIFGLTNLFEESIDIVRFIYHCTDNSAMDDGNFCAESELNNGIVLRKWDDSEGHYINYWTVKNNGDWGELAYDKSYDDRGKPPSSTYGLTTRLTYGGQSKHGVVIRLDPFDRIELVVQDDLTGITTGNIMVEGHFVQN